MGASVSTSVSTRLDITRDSRDNTKRDCSCSPERTSIGDNAAMSEDKNPRKAAVQSVITPCLKYFTAEKLCCEVRKRRRHAKGEVGFNQNVFSRLSSLFCFHSTLLYKLRIPTCVRTCARFVQDVCREPLLLC